MDMYIDPRIVNGVDVAVVNELIDRIDGEAAAAQFQFRVRNQWIEGGLNRSSIKEFYAAGKEDDTRKIPFVLDADEPPIMASEDRAPNPAEFVLHALAGCPTTTMVYHAAVRGIVIDAIDSKVEGDLDVRGLLGLSTDVRKGFHHVRVTMRVESDASVKELTELAEFSAVYDIVSQSLPVKLQIIKL